MKVPIKAAIPTPMGIWVWLFYVFQAARQRRPVLLALIGIVPTHE